MNVLITGGAGYVGTSLVDELLERDDVDEVLVYDNLSRKNYNLFLGDKIIKHKKLHFIKGELLDSRHLRKVLQHTDVVYHLAAKVTTPFANEDAHFFEQVNHWGTAELIYAVEESSVSKFIYVSSTSVYGSSKEAVKEDQKPNPRTFYGISKLRGEEHVSRLADNMDTYMLRCGNVYGFNRSMRFDAVINKFVFEAHFNKQLTIHGDGKQYRSFIHIDHVAKGLANLLDNNVKPGTYNLVDKDLQVMDIVDVLKQIYPQLEFLFVNQHLKLRELIVHPNAELNNKLGIESNPELIEELQEFVNHFSF